MDFEEKTEQLLLLNSNKRYIDLLRAALSWRNISNKQVSKNVKIPEATVSKVLNGKIISKKTYYKTITVLMERYDIIDLFREMIESFDVIDYEIQTRLDLLEENKKRILELNRKYYMMHDPYYSGN